jgi:hypothetical protein
MDKIKVEAGWKVTLIGPEGKALPEWYEVKEILDNERIKIVGSDQIPLRIFRSRIASVVSKPEEKEEGSMEPETAQVKPAAPVAPVTPTEPEKEKPAATKAEVKKPASAKKEPAKKADPPALDLKAYCKEHGGDSYILLKKVNDFKAPGYTSIAYVLINPEKHIYRTFNAYKYPDGTLSLGHRGSGGNDYPLEGKKTLVTKCKKVSDGSEVHKPFHGKLTAEALMEAKKKKGYQQVPKMPEKQS